MSHHRTPPPVEQLKAKARRVFGDVVFDDAEHSLSYSPSPTSSMQQLNESSTIFQQSAYDENDGATSSHDGGESSRTSTTFDNGITTSNSEKENSTNSSLLSQDKSSNQMKASPVSRTRRSPLRRDLVKKTQDAINRASASVHASLREAPKPVHFPRKEQGPPMAKPRQVCDDDLAGARALRQEAERTRREYLASRRQVASQQSRDKVRRQMDNRAEIMNKQEKDSLFKSAVYREHQRMLREEDERRRRLSVDARAKARVNHRKGTEKIRLSKIQENMTILEERYEASVAQRHVEKENMRNRRKSFAFRNGDARRIRELHAELEAERQQIERKNYELKWESGKDAENYRRQLDEQRRQSLALRNREGHRQRELESHNRSDSLAKEHESYELKWAGESDALKYQQQLDKQRRESLARRNLENRHQRDEHEREKESVAKAEHESYELKWASEKDVDAYRESMQKAKRESFARRNKQRAHHAKVVEELQTIAREKETESLVLKWAGQEDAKAYLAKLEAERRQSLQQRARQVLHYRAVESESKNKDLIAAHENELLKSEDDKEVAQYKAKCRERDRLSLEYRRMEARMQRLQEAESKAEQQKANVAGFELETQARSDVQEYINECKRRRRLSLAYRAQEKRRHGHWRREQAQYELEERNRIIQGNLMDQRYVELARQQERAKIAMDTIQHSGLSFNPFAKVIK